MTKLTREQCGVAVGDMITIRGTVKFAKLDRPIEGKALDKLNQRRVNKGMKETKPFRRITIKNPIIVEGQGTPLAKFYEQDIYRNIMTLESKSLFPPVYKHIQDGEAVHMEDPKKNPVTGQEMMIKLSAYQSKGFAYLGSGLDSIIFPEGPIQFYEVSRAEENLAGFGESKDLLFEPSIVNTRAFAAAPIIGPEKMGVDISSSPFGGVVNSVVNEEDLSVQTVNMTRNDATMVPPAVEASEQKILHVKDTKADTNAIDIDSPFGPSRIPESTKKADPNSTRPLSRFT
ncbi:hypothetical protein NST38_30725 [Paenibacillus sp. FSL H8-0104]|uniref:hypothetical protein n=1 Tax=Paenibacillus sp. FSL H8-0104 TaxID=2954509 RepID=UPI0030FD8A2D